MRFLEKLDQHVKSGQLSPHLSASMKNFFLSYMEAAQNQYDREKLETLLDLYLELVIEQIKDPFSFEPFHRHLTEPLNYYAFGLDLIRPLIIFDQSTVIGQEHIQQMERQLANKENVILLANHQTEPDPQAISLLLEKEHPEFAENMIFIAGHRVITDPLAIPLSMGRNLLCIFSKKHIENPPELKSEKLLHNQRTMKMMGQLLNEGGKCIYVAPSGGRDRPNSFGKIDVARFDPKSIEMFWLMTQQADKVSHFYPLALATYKLLPPPNSVGKEIGERRHAHCTPIHLAFGKEIDMEKFPGSDIEDKKLRRKARADYIWELVNRDYLTLLNIQKNQSKNPRS